MSGIPTIPAGAQIGGAGTAENHAAAQAAPQTNVVPAAPTPQADVPPVPVRDPVTGQWVLPQAAPVVPSTPLVPERAPVPTVDVAVDSTPKAETVDVTPVAVGATYLETAVNHFTADTGVTEDALIECIGKAIEHGDEALINVSTLGELTPEQAARAEQLAKLAYQHSQQQLTDLRNTIYSAAGGEAQWAAAINAFNTSAPEQTRGYVAYLIDSLNDGKAAAEYVLNYVNYAGLVTQVNKAPVQGGSGAPVATGLTVQEYKNGIHEIELLYNGRKITQSEYDVRLADLDYRRGIGRKQGR